MIKVVGIRFRQAGKIYYFDPGELEISKEDCIIVETARGIEFGHTVVANKEVDEKEIVSPLKKVIRMADENDMRIAKENAEKEKEAYKVCCEKVILHKLDMKLIDVECTFDNNKILFYFTADGRIDFRDLVKDLAMIFRTRIELRQIGVRDESKMMGGLGICGRALCCNTYLSEFQPVSIKMAKEQGLSLNPTKISGVCGRLMCCLKYEQDAYEYLMAKSPKIGAIVDTPDGRGMVVNSNLLKELVKVRLNTENDTDVRIYPVADTKVIEDAAKPDEEPETADLKVLED